MDDGLLTGGEMREWLYVSGLDKVPCETCSEMDGQRVGIDEPFVTPEGEELMNPPAHPNCRCGQGLVTEAERVQEIADMADEDTSLETASAFRVLGGPGSGYFNHAGRPGEIGGSASSDAEEFNTLIGISSSEKRLDLPVKDGVPEDVRPGFGRCTDNALAYAKKSGADVYVGYAVDRDRYDSAVTTFKKDGSVNTTEAFPHAWNVQNGKIVDTTLGSAAAKDHLYFGMKFTGKVASGDALAAWHSAQRVDTSRALGGPGSGFFGHAGRPGEVGGSSSDDSGAFYHGTSADIAEKIKTEGLKSSYGRVYVADDARVAVAYPLADLGPNARTDDHKENARIALVVISREAEKYLDAGVGHNFSTKHDDIPAEYIKEVRIYAAKDFDAMRQDPTAEWPTPLRVLALGDLYVSFALGQESPVLASGWDDEERGMIDVEERDLGGPGSGNFGHAGRPGEVGGSAPGEPDSRIQTEVTAVRDVLGSKESLFEAAYLVGSFGKGDSERAPDRRGVGTSDVDVLLVAKPVIGKWRERADHRDAVAQAVSEVRSRLEAVSQREVHVWEGGLIETEGHRKIWESVSRQAGGPGSGFFNHAGRPGETGGSTEGESQAARRDNPVQARVADFRTSTNIKGSERVLVVDRSGNTLVDTKGEKHGVSLDQYVSKIEPGSTIVHNHPGDRSFSSTDFHLAGLTSPAELIASGPTYDFSLRAGENGWPSASVMQETYLAAQKRARLLLAKHFTDFESPKAQWALDHLTSRLAADDLGLSYSVESVVDRALGGQGSGFFGHSGRPGEVGGSASSEDGAAPVDALKKLTEGKGLTSGLSKLSPSEVEDVKSWLKEQRPTDVPVYRGIWLTTQQWEDSNFWRVGRADGYALKEVSAPQTALSSWTRDSSRVSAYGTGGDVFVTFKLPSGIAVDIASHSVYPVEKEALLPEKLNSSVVKAEMTSPGSWTLELENKRSAR